jgi:immune inhibitor A
MAGRPRVMRINPVYRDLCCVAPTEEVAAAMAQQATRIAEEMGMGGGSVRVMAARPEGRHLPRGFNDGTIYPPSHVAKMSRRLGVSPESLRLAPPLPRGEVRVLVLMVDFEDNPFQDADALRASLRDMLFSEGAFPTGSLCDYYLEVSGGKVWFSGIVAGPYRAPQPYTRYTDGRSGTGSYPHNTPRLVEEITAVADPDVDYAQFDRNGDGYVDGLILVHAGPGAEEIVKPAQRCEAIWSHKWTTSVPQVFDNTNVYAYLVVPEQSTLGVWAHELGHLIFGWPDLYDIDNSSEGVGNYCLMGSGSWNADGARPAHPCAWCKVQRNWVEVSVPRRDQEVTIPPVETDPRVYKLWTRGQPGQEYFLLENRQQIGFDDNLPDRGLAIYHVDESQPDNSQESRYMVGLEQADGRQDLEKACNRGDATDLWPEGENRTFDALSTPSSGAHSGARTFVAVSNIEQVGTNVRAAISVETSRAWGDGAGEQPVGCAEAILGLLRAIARRIQGGGG